MKVTLKRKNKSVSSDQTKKKKKVGVIVWDVVQSKIMELIILYCEMFTFEKRYAHMINSAVQWCVYLAQSKLLGSHTLPNPSSSVLLS